MIRQLAALAAGCAMLCAPALAQAATTGGTLGPGATSSAFQPTAATPFSISVLAPSCTSSACRGVGFTVLRSQDGVNYAPLAEDQTGTPAHYYGPLTVDLIEQRTGTYYQIQADASPNVAFSYRFDQ